MWCISVYSGCRSGHFSISCLNFPFQQRISVDFYLCWVDNVVLWTIYSTPCKTEFKWVESIRLFLKLGARMLLFFSLCVQRLTDYTRLSSAVWAKVSGDGSLPLLASWRLGAGDYWWPAANRKREINLWSLHRPNRILGTSDREGLCQVSMILSFLYIHTNISKNIGVSII